MGNSKIKANYTRILIVFVMMIALVTACSKGDDKDKSQGPKDEELNINVGSDNISKDDDLEDIVSDNPLVGETVLTVDGEKVSYSEAILYLKYIQTYYENIFGSTIWDYDLGNKTIGDLAKQDVIDTITERKISKKQWNKYDVLITEEDEMNIKKDSSDYLKNLTKNDMDYYGITEEIVYQFFFDNLMAERVYDATTMNIDTNIPDEEAKQITIQYLLVSTKKVNSQGELVPVTDEEKKTAYAKAQELLNQASTVEDFMAFAKANTDSPEIEMTFGKNDIEDVVADAAFALKEGEMSNIIESEDGYLILYCVDDYNEDATLAKKEEIIDDRQMNLFEELFETWQKDVKVELNKDVWDEITFD